MDFKITLGVFDMVFILFILIDVLKYIFMGIACKEIRQNEVVGDLIFWGFNGLNLYFQTIWLGLVGLGLWFSISFMGSRWVPVMYGRWIKMSWSMFNHRGNAIHSSILGGE